VRSGTKLEVRFFLDRDIDSVDQNDTRCYCQLFKGVPSAYERPDLPGFGLGATNYCLAFADDSVLPAWVKKSGSPKAGELQMAASRID
jgi:hypothetical protein